MTRTLGDIEETNSRLQRMAGDNFLRASRIRDIAQAYARNIYNSRQYKRAAEYGGSYADDMSYDMNTYRGVKRHRVAAKGNANQ